MSQYLLLQSFVTNIPGPALDLPNPLQGPSQGTSSLGSTLNTHALTSVHYSTPVTPLSLFSLSFEVRLLFERVRTLPLPRDRLCSPPRPNPTPQGAPTQTGVSRWGRHPEQVNLRGSEPEETLCTYYCRRSVSMTLPIYFIFGTPCESGPGRVSFVGRS